MNKFVLAALIVAGVAQGTPAAHANNCVVWNPLNPKCWVPNVDPVACPMLASLSPGIPGVIDIDSEGDVSVSDVPVWDCPPYGIR